MKTINIRLFVAGLAISVSAAHAIAPQEIAPKQIGDFKQGSIKGLPGVLPLNPLSLAVIGNAPDSELHVITGALHSAHTEWARQPVGNTYMGGVTLKTLEPLLPTAEETRAIGNEQNPRKLPGWAQPEPYSSAPEVVNGRHVLYPTPTRLARAEFLRNIYRAVQADVRTAKEYALILPAKPVQKQLPGSQGLAANGELQIPWTVVGEARGPNDGTLSLTLPNLDADGTVARCTGLPLGNLTSGASATFLTKPDADVVCLAFRNMRGVHVPMSIKIRDMNQFKAGDNVRIAIVFTLTLAPAQRIQSLNGVMSELQSISIVDAKASYLQIIEVSSMQTLGPKIPIISPDLTYLEVKDCAFAITRGNRVSGAIATSNCLAPAAN